MTQEKGTPTEKGIWTSQVSITRSRVGEGDGAGYPQQLHFPSEGDVEGR